MILENGVVRTLDPSLPGLDEVIGQTHLLGPDGRDMLEAIEKRVEEEYRRLEKRAATEGI